MLRTRKALQKLCSLNTWRDVIQADEVQIHILRKSRQVSLSPRGAQRISSMQAFDANLLRV